MKTIRFTKRCRDKHTDEVYEVGTIKSFEDERADEIISKNFAIEGNAFNHAAEIAENDNHDESEETELNNSEDEVVSELPPTAENTMINLYDLKKAELVEIAKQNNVSTSGKKEEIIERLLSLGE